DGIRDRNVTGVQTCALPICSCARATWWNWRSTGSAGSASSSGRPEMAVITDLDVLDIRFPTSRELDGSDAMNPDPDYSAAYVVLRADEGPDGYGFTFTIGRGNDVQAAAIHALEPLVAGKPVPEDAKALAALSADLVGDSQLRWLGPEKGVAHMAIGAVVNAAWDLAARRAGRPLWRFLAELSPEQIAGLV